MGSRDGHVLKDTLKTSPYVHGITLDAQTRCAHYNSPLDIIAIRMKCCGLYYACKDCHDALAGHAIEVWPRTEWKEPAILCGTCRTELTIMEYLSCANECPVCKARFNPACRTHYRFYFETEEADAASAATARQAV
jgi:uncharacterized CHY-type Zn-finger protein